MTLAKRLYLLILAAVLGVAVIAGIGFTQMTSVFTKANYSNENVIPSMIQLSRAQKAFTQARIIVYRLVLNTDASKTAEIETQVRESLLNAANLLKKYEGDGMISDDKDRQLLRNSLSLIQEYETGLKPIIEHARAQRADKALESLIQAAGNAEKLNTALENHTLYNEELAKKSADAAIDTQKTANLFLIISGLITLVVVAALGLLTLRAVLRQLGGEPAVASALALQMSTGDLSAEITLDKGDDNSLMAAMKSMQTSLRNMAEEAGRLQKAAIAGQLSTRADVSLYQGEYAKIIGGINATLDAVIGPLNVAAGYVDRIARGDVPPRISDAYNGDFNTLKNNLNTCIDAINKLISDAGMLAQAAVAGQLSTRADATQHQGDFRRIVEGVNNTLDAVIGPLNVAASYVDRIAKGDIPHKITDSYNGDFNAIKNNLNTCIDAISKLVADARLLSAAAVAGKLDTRADAAQHQGDFRRIVEGVNDTLDAVVSPIQDVQRVMTAMAAGDMTQTISKSYQGDFATLKDS
ncbi:MAG: MCP four helix bundle domain-containing protein, partial [Azonexus sp.]